MSSTMKCKRDGITERMSMRGRALFIAATCAIFPTRWRDLATFVQKLQRSPSSMCMSHLELRGKMGGRERDVCKGCGAVREIGGAVVGGGGRTMEPIFINVKEAPFVPRYLLLGEPSTLSRQFSTYVLAGLWPVHHTSRTARCLINSTSGHQCGTHQRLEKDFPASISATAFLVCWVGWRRPLIL